MKNIKSVKYFLLEILVYYKNKKGLKPIEIENILFNNKEFFLTRIEVLKNRLLNNINFYRDLENIENKEVSFFINKLNYYKRIIIKDNNFNYNNYLDKIRINIIDKFLTYFDLSYIFYIGVTSDLKKLVDNKEIIKVKRGFYRINII